MTEKYDVSSSKVSKKTITLVVKKSVQQPVNVYQGVGYELQSGRIIDFCRKRMHYWPTSQDITYPTLNLVTCYIWSDSMQDCFFVFYTENQYPCSLF